MHVLVIIAETAQRFLIKLEKDEHIKEIKHLVRSRKRKKAIESALSKGQIVKELAEYEVPFVSADLTLTKEGSYWNLL
ncbi:MAG: hypothetical protein KAU58_04300 [Candidatus Omnitrophica bacterium]|nr:hypothetical protein [Candidatus Omnitrophota bacterium]